MLCVFLLGQLPEKRQCSENLSLAHRRQKWFFIVMYLRPIWTKRKAYWALVKSVRTGKKVRQEVVAYLGALSAKGVAKAQGLARQLGLKPDQPGLFDAPL